MFVTMVMVDPQYVVLNCCKSYPKLYPTYPTQINTGKAIVASVDLGKCFNFFQYT